MSDLYLPSGKLLVPRGIAQTTRQVALTMPLASLRALFELLCWLQEGEFERRLREYTDLPEKDIAELGQSLDALHQYLWQNGMRPLKQKQNVVRQGKKLIGKVFQMGGDAPEGFKGL